MMDLEMQPRAMHQDQQDHLEMLQKLQNLCQHRVHREQIMPKVSSGLQTSRQMIQQG